MADETPKIIIDEDWKAQVQREKEEAARKAASEPADTVEASEPLGDADAGAAGETGAAAGDGAPDEGEEASFASLVQSLATQALFALGAIAPPGEQRVMVHLDQAKFLIETLDVLREKTKGNLTAEEQGLLTEAMAELQQIYVQRAHQMQEQMMKQAGVDPQNLR